MATLASAVAELNRLIAGRKLVEGIDRFYDDNVVMTESASQSTAGKAANRERERVFVDGLTKWNATLHDTVIDETRGVALSRWTIEYDHTQFGAGVLRQIAAQQWRDGRIVEESFYKV
ncbi:MAG TPA: nuclear transport factor 2 family protein [Thermoanaerobaculia bacterium]|nr:nuclear transport factor 2 family protein [Thermoanaerobaculia bacterium]